MKKIVLLSNRRTSSKIALFEQSEFAVLEVRDLESNNFCNEIFAHEVFYSSKIKSILSFLFKLNFHYLLFYH